MSRKLAALLVWLLHLGVLVGVGVLIYAVIEANEQMSQQAYMSTALAAVASLAAMMLTHQGGLVGRLHAIFFANHWSTTIRHVVFLRFQILSAGLLAIFPFVAVFYLASFARNLYDMSLLDLFFVTWLAETVAWTVMACSVLTVRYGHLRFGGEALRFTPSTARWADRGRLAVFGLLAAPQFAMAWVMLPSDQQILGALAIVCGIGAAWMGLCIATILREWMAPSNCEPSRLLLDGARFQRETPRTRSGFRLSWLFRLLGDGYYDTERQQPWAGHLHAAALFLVTFITYAMFGYLFAPNSSWHELLPSLAYVLMLFMLAAWALPALAFYLDRWRLPVLVLLLLATLLLHTLAPTSNVFLIQTLRAPAAPVGSRVSALPTASDGVATNQADPSGEAPRVPPPSPLISAAQALDRRLAASRAPDRMIVVLASGGGIAAASWTASVLTGLEAWLGGDFTQSLMVVSAVSGGSVGTIFYLDDFATGQRRTDVALQRIRNAAAGNSLRATAWGAAYCDLWRFAAPPLARFFPVDRGWAMEANWNERLTHPDATLRDWGAQVNEGKLPVAILAATTVETGEPYLFAPVKLTPPQRPRIHTFVEQFPDHDLHVATAARASATFPWVSPIARPALTPLGDEPATSGGESPFSLADGAYFDNFGVIGADAWLASAAPRRTAGLKILLIRINAWDVDDGQTAAPMESPPVEAPRNDWLRAGGWIYATYGPLKTMLSVRRSSQMAQEQRIRTSWSNQIELQDAAFNLRVTAPMSWKLSRSVTQQIAQAWDLEMREAEGNSDSPAARVRRFLQRR